jgi:hypothetical protein
VGINGWVNARGNGVANRDLIEAAFALDGYVKQLVNLPYECIPGIENRFADGLCNAILDEEEANRSVETGRINVDQRLLVRRIGICCKSMRHKDSLEERELLAMQIEKLNSRHRSSARGF